MKKMLFRTSLVSVFMVFSIVRVYAHHGSQFLNTAIEANVAEVKLGELALSKTHNDRVKDFAQMIVTDHTMALDRMTQLLNDRNAAMHTQYETNWKQVRINRDHQQTSDRLGKLSGDEFDRQFILTMVRDHKTAIHDFEMHARSHGNPPSNSTSTRQKPSPRDNTVDYALDTDTTAFARETLPTLNMHLQMAEDIQKNQVGPPTSKP